MTTPHDPEFNDHEPSEDDLPQAEQEPLPDLNDALLSGEKPPADASLSDAPCPTPRVRKPSDKPVAVVTGAARRVGREIALAMAERGLAVVIHHGTSAVEAKVLMNRIKAAGGTAVAVGADLRDPRAAAATIFD